MKHQIGLIFFAGNFPALRQYMNVATAIITVVVLGGCGTLGALTRVNMATYQREYDELYPMGMDHADAVRKIEAAGYSCDKPYDNRTMTHEGVKVPVMAQSCSKASLELMCPQRRFIWFNFTSAQKKVIWVDKPKLTEQSCF